MIQWSKDLWATAIALEAWFSVVADQIEDKGELDSSDFARMNPGTIAELNDDIWYTADTIDTKQPATTSSHCLQFFEKQHLLATRHHLRRTRSLGLAVTQHSCRLTRLGRMLNKTRFLLRVYFCWRVAGNTSTRILRLFGKAWGYGVSGITILRAIGTVETWAEAALGYFLVTVFATALGGLVWWIQHLGEIDG